MNYVSCRSCGFVASARPITCTYTHVRMRSGAKSRQMYKKKIEYANNSIKIVQKMLFFIQITEKRAIKKQKLDKKAKLYTYRTILTYLIFYCATLSSLTRDLYLSSTPVTLSLTRRHSAVYLPILDNTRDIYLPFPCSPSPLIIPVSSIFFSSTDRSNCCESFACLNCLNVYFAYLQPPENVPFSRALDI